jgi:N-acetylglucosaminyldiphosphoundecaprenol N-acetyl-beta-D-mannosaminyltransferase
MKSPRLSILGTPLVVTNYDRLRDELFAASDSSSARTVDFSNTHIVTMRRHDPAFRRLTSTVDMFVPDGMPLIWCLNQRGAKLQDRVYGPTFTRRCLSASPPHIRHFFLGGSEECLRLLVERMRALNPHLSVAGTHHGYFNPADEASIAETIRASQADFIWVGMGTPRQQEWIARNRAHFPREIILAVGFAFDVNAGTKPDAPESMQRLGLTWLYRLLSEPRRLFGRYLRWNSLFLFYLIRDAFLPSPMDADVTDDPR